METTTLPGSPDYIRTITAARIQPSVFSGVFVPEEVSGIGNKG
jgi:hypothetical protein